MFTTSQNSISRALIFLASIGAVFALSACSLDGSVEYLNGGPKGTGLQGKALMFQISSQSQSLANVSLSTCTDKKVTIHAVKTDGSIETSSLGESKISEDGSFEIPDSSQYPLGDSVTYVLMASGCGESFYRPVTDYTDQDISMGTTFLGFLPEVDDSGKKQLNTLTLSQMSTVLAKLTSVNESNLSQSFDTIAQDAASKSAFEALTGISMESLKEIPPTTVAISLPSTIKEGQSNSLSVTASHWYSGYSKAYQWFVDGVSLSTASNLSWSLGKNSQGPHTVVLKVGANGGAGNIDLGKPVYQKSMSLNVQDTYPATPPGVTMLARTNSSVLTVTINTGAALVNCETFSLIAITEGFLPPSASDFTRTCTTTGTQAESFTLSNTEFTRQVSVWVKDAAGNISTTYSGQFVTLDTTPPDLTLNNLTGTQTANTSTSVHWSASDLSGLASLTLQYASDGITFSDVVDLLVSNSTSPYTWTVPTDNVTTAKLKLVATDNAGNSNSITTNAFSIDATVPGPPVATLSGAPTITNGAFDISITFTEAITGLSASDFTVTNGSASNLVTVSGGSYTLTITPSIASGSTGVTTVKLPLGTVVDYSSDPNSADSNTLSVNVDKTVPTIMLSSTAPNPTNSSITVTATLSESVTGFDASDINASNATVSGFGGSGTSYSFTLTPSADGVFSVDVPAASFHDLASNASSASNTLTRTYDTTRPSLSLASSTSSPTNGAIAVTATFSESVTGFDASDVTVTNASVGAVTGSGTTYTFTVTPTITSGNTGTVTIDVLANKAQDSASNLNTASNTLSYSIDKVAPTLTLSSTTSNPTNGTIAVTATFSESVSGFNASDVTATNATVGTFAGSGATYTFVVTPTIASSATGTVAISVATGVAQDAATNDNAASNTLSYTVDKIVPTVTLTSSDPDPVNGNISVTATFSESVTGFDSSDLTVTNAVVTGFSGSGTTYSITLTPILNSAVTIQANTSIAQDSAGNANTASNTLSRTYDSIQPTVTLSSATTSPTSGAISVTATFSESVTGFDASDVTVTNATVGAVVGSGTTYTFTVTPTIAAGATGTVTIQVPANKAIDGASNQNLVSNTLTYSIDKVFPTVTLTSVTSDPTNGTILVTATFSKSVTGFTSSSVNATSANVSAVSGSGTIYAFNVAPTTVSGATGTVTIQVSANAGQDSAGNDSTASNTLTYSIDKVVPTVALTSSSPDPTNANVTVTATFSKSVTGFDSSDLTISNGSVSSVSGSGTTYSVVVTPTVAAQSTGTLSIQVAASSATDSAGNANTASNTLTRSIDTRGPSVTLASASASTVTGSFSVTATLSLSSTDFASGDVSVTGGSVSNFAGSGTSYTFDVIPSAQQASPGIISVSVAAGTLTDSTLGNANTVSNTLTRTATTLTQTWSTTLSSSDTSVLPVAGGVASLSSTNLTQTDFSTGTHVGTSYDATNGNRLTLDKTLPSPKEMDSSWAPKWSNVVGYWKLNSDFSAALGLNLSASGAGATVNSASAKIGSGGAVFNGSSYAAPTLGSATYSFPNTTFTVAGWFNTSDATSSYLIANGVSATAGWGIRLVSGTLALYIKNSAGNQINFQSYLIVNDAKWHQFFAVITTNTTTEASNSLVLYVDGTSISTSRYLPGTGAYNDPGSTMALSFGARDVLATPANFYTGKLDEVMIWNTALTANEVSYIYNKQNPNSAQSELDSSWTPHWNNLVGYWKMNGDWKDSTGNSNNGNATGSVSFSTDVKLGSYAGSILGSTSNLSYVQIPNSSTLQDVQESNFSIAGWFKPLGVPANTSTDDQEYAILMKPGYNMGLSYTNAKKFSMKLWQSNGSPKSALSQHTFETNQYYYLVGTVDFTNQKIRLYVDGILEKESSFDGTIKELNTNTWILGLAATSGTSRYPAYGNFDEFGIWKTVLTASEVLQIYNRQQSKFGGAYISPIQALNTTSSWKSMNWSSSLPFLKEIPGDTNADATPDSESSADYSGISANLSDGLQTLYHFNESSWNGTSNEIKDSSGKGNHTKASNSAQITKSGLLNSAARLDGIDDYIAVPSALLTSNTETTVSLWMKSASIATGIRYAFANVQDANGSRFYMGVSGSSFVAQMDGGSSTTYGTVNVNQWYLMTMVWRSDGTGTLYIDGAPAIQFSSITGSPGSAATIGAYNRGSSSFFNGDIDEVGIWNRALTASELLQLYRRGANRNKFQFRTCTQSDCSDKTDADWVGPDKTASSWFSELHNMTAVASTGDGSGSINLTSPLLDFSKWIAAVSGWAFSPAPARYFQYRALMESDDVNNLCLDSLNNAIPCMPDVTSVTPTAELSPAPYITSVTGISFYTTLSSLSFTISGTCASDSTYPAKFQLSKDGGSTFQYYNGTSWATAASGTYSQASTIAQINAGLSSYTCSSAPCTLTFRAYPGTNTANSCNISAPVASVNRY